MEKVTFLLNKLMHYRIPIYNILAQHYDLTVVSSFPIKEEHQKQCQFKLLYVPVLQMGKFYWHKQSVKKLCKDSDVVIVNGEITYLDYTLMSLLARRYKLIYWSIGAPASRKRHYGEASSLYYSISDFFKKRADALVFYTEKARQMHIERGFNSRRLFVANNTVKVEKIDIDEVSLQKEYILFIGTLYLEKGLQVLLDTYQSAYEENPMIPPMKIVGEGEHYEAVCDWIDKNGLQDKIEMKGAIYDVHEKAKVICRAIACVSPFQAGLSVLECLGYGVPFVTCKDAITGGELFNIQNGKNGVLLDDAGELKDVILDMTNNKRKYIIMGENGYSYYWKYRTPEIMAQGLIDAIRFVDPA